MSLQSCWLKGTALLWAGAVTLVWPQFAAATWSAEVITVGAAATERVYRVYRPVSAKPGAPMVVLLHGGAQSMHKVLGPNAGGSKQWVAIAEREGAVLLVPNATQIETGDARSDNQTWNDLRAHGTPKQANDVGFIRELVRHELMRQNADARRVYLTGSSNGGMMVFRLLIEAPELFAAAATFIANLPENLDALPSPKRATPLMMANGTRDALVRWEGGIVAGDPARGRTASTADTLAWWIKTNRAQSVATSTEVLPDADPNDGCRILLKRHGSGHDGAPVWLYVAEGAGHAMPSASHRLPDNSFVQRVVGPACRDAEGTELAWAFFVSHGRSAR